MPDVRMPDGTIIRNVPEGTTRSQLMARYGKAKPAKPKGGSFGHGLADSLTFGLLDEAGAVLDTLGLPAGEKRPNIWNGAGFGDAYNANVKRNREILREKQRANPGEFLTGQIGGALVPLGAGKGKIAQVIQKAATGKKTTTAAKVGKVAANVAPDAARGAAYGAGSAEGGLAERAKGAGKGAAAGVGGHVAGRAIGAGVARTLKGKQVSPAVRELADAGVVMTPGQRAGPGSIRKGLEEGVLGSLPVVRTIPQAAKRRGIEQLNVAAINKALEPIGFKLPKGTKPGRELIQKAGDAVYSAYDASVAPLTLSNDSGLKGAASALKKGARASVGQGDGQLKAIIDRVTMQLDNGPISGDQVRDLVSDLRGDAATYTSSSVASERKLGSELWKLHDHLSSALVRQNKGAAVKKFTKARDAVANFKRIEDASSKAADGVFNPTQLRQAVTRRGYGTTTSKVARGEARLQSLADAAKQVLPDNLPNSGTPERALAVGLAGGGPGIVGLMNPYAGGAAGMATLPYVPGIDRLLQNLAINRPDLLVKLGVGIERATPALGTAGAMTSVGVNSQP
jgi:hypothetical protein